MHRGSHFGVPFDATYSRRGYHNDDKMIELIQQFRAFKPYLKKRLDYITQSGKSFELRDEVDEIKLYLDVMQDVLADDKHGGPDQIRGFIDKIHEMIRKNPMTETLPSHRRSLDPDDQEFDDNDRPRSPSPGAMGSSRIDSESTASHIPLISSHDAHRVVEVNFSAGGDSARDNEVDEWGKPIIMNSFTRREPYQDVDMRQSYFAPGSMGRGQPRRWSGESCGRGIGRGMPPRQRDGFDRINLSHGFGESDSHYRNDGFFLDRGCEPPRERRVVKTPAWMLDNPPNGTGNVNNVHVNDHQRHGDVRENTWDGMPFERRHREPHREDEWRRSQSENRDREKYHQQLNQYVERRPSSESRGHEKRDDFGSRERPRDSSRDMSSPPMNQGHSHRDYPGVRPPFPHPPNKLPVNPPMPNAMHMSHPPPRPGFGYGHHPPYGANQGPGLLPTPPMAYQNPLHPHGNQNASSPAMHATSQQLPSGVGRSMSFQQPPVNSYNRHDIPPAPNAYHIPPPQMPPPPRPHHSSPLDPYGHGYDPDETSTDKVRQISSRLAKQCFTRRPATTTSSQVPPGQISPGPVSPQGHSPGQGALDPRLNRQSQPGMSPIQRIPRNRSPPRRQSPSDAGNVLKPSATDPRFKHRVDQEKRNLEEKRERVRQAEACRPAISKPSKLQELRKQIEKEGFHRLGRPAPNSKKQSGSFEDALASCDNEPDPASNKEKSKSSSPTRTKEKEKDKDESRSHSNKTEAGRSAKHGEKGKTKDKSPTKGSGIDKQLPGASDKLQRKKSDRADKDKGERSKSKKASSPKPGASGSSKGTSKSGQTSEKSPLQEPSKLSGFKIPRKPKPKEPEVEVINIDNESHSSEKDVSVSPPSSPEPALSQDSDNRVEDSETATSSSKQTAKRSSNTSEVDPATLSFLKQFLMSSVEPADSDILTDEKKLKEIFFKIKSEISAAKTKSTQEINSDQSAPEELEKEKNSIQGEEDPQGRGRSREKKRNSKRRSSLEKLHDALQEMGFDSMLPLGPRRCTRSGQDESDTTESSELPIPAEPSDEVVFTSTSSAVVPSNPEVESAESPTKVLRKRRGRPPKEASKKQKKATAKKPVSPVEKGQTSTTADLLSLSQVPEPPPPVPARRGRKRKIKAAKVAPRKRTKKSGPVTRAQAALKKSHKDLSKPSPRSTGDSSGLENTTKDSAARKRKTTNMMLRRLTKKRIGAKDTAVNLGLNKIKIDSDNPKIVKAELASMMKQETLERDEFLHPSDSAFNNTSEQSNVASQLADLIEHLDHDTVASMDRQTEENMDLDVFNTLDADDQTSEVFIVKEELDIPIDEMTSDISFDTELNKSTTTPRKTRRSGAASTSPTTLSNADNVIPESRGENATTELANQNDTVTPVTENDGQQGALPESDIPITTNDDIESVVKKTTCESASKEPTAAQTSEQNGETDGISVDTDIVEKPGNTKASSNNSDGLCAPLPTSIEAASADVTAQFEKSEDSSSSVPTTGNVSSQLSFLPESQSFESVEIGDEGTVKSELGVEIKPEPVEVDELRKDVFKCEQCSYAGKNIVKHYVNKHYPCNIPQARLMPETFDGLIELNSSESPQLLEIILDENQHPIWPCLYCDDRHECIVDFYDHLTSHTGEYRYECAECGTSYPQQKSLQNHVKQHKGIAKSCVRIAFDSVVDKTSKDLSGFLCNDCYYFQLRFESIMRHIEETRHSATDVKSVKLICPSDNDNIAPADGANIAAETKANVSQETMGEKVPLESQGGLNPTENQTTETMEKDKSSVSEAKKGEDECVFFGTDVKLSAPSVSLFDCTTVNIARVFEDKFLDSLLKRVCEEPKEGFESILNEVKNDNSQPENRKRKRSGSLEEEHEDDSKGDVVPPVKESTVAESSSTTDEKPAPKRRPNLRTTCSTRAHKLIKWKDEEASELLNEEPNNFFISSDESSDDTDTESDDEKPDVDSNDTSEPSQLGKEVVVKVEHVDETLPRAMRNNEHLIKTRNIAVDEFDLKTLKVKKLIRINRAGDCHAPGTVLYGYNRANAGKTAPKLRDVKEIERLSSLGGRRTHALKSTNRLKEMLTNQKLMHFFKCMGTYCSFTCDNPAEFVTHLYQQHNQEEEPSCSRFYEVDDIKRFKDSDCCCYCSANYRDPKELLDHVINQHAQSQFQCNRCFYRSFYHRYVVRHFDMEHPTESTHVLKCQKKFEVQSQEATLFQIFVYKCDIENAECDKSRRFVFREDFIEHLNQCVPPRELYPCHLCKENVPISDIIEHYKGHNLFKFHCSYCPFGSEVKTDLDEHFVQVHPNTSGRVFYRVKPTSSNHVNSIVIGPKPVPHKTSREARKQNKVTAVERDADIENLDSNGPTFTPEKEQQANAENSINENSGMDISENEDNEKGRVANLKGYDLYRCVTGGCNFAASDSEKFKDHVSNCPYVTESRSLSCAHCERKLKTVTNLLEHLKVHGEKKQVCSLCSFRCWTSTEITKHVKTVHRVMSYKLIRNEITATDTDPDIIAFPKDVAAKSACTVESFENHYYTFSRKAMYSFENIDKLPQSKVFGSDLHCAMCPYSTKVRSNIVRHLSIHKQALEDGITVVPQAPRINPVPYLSREGLEFDKMMNLAASSHRSDGGSANEDDVLKLPQFVKEQFRYVCSVCDHITSDDALLQTHIKVIHSEVSLYHCPHCHKNPETRENPDNTVPLEKISYHLRLHGPKLYKCGHCMMVHHQLRLMEKHIPEKHPEKKPIHYLIRDVDPDGIPSSRPTTSGMSRRQSSDDPKLAPSEKWKCFLCSSKTAFGSWLETKAHCESVHKITSQFKCLVCDFASDDVTEMLTHCKDNCKSDRKKQILVMFSKYETFDAEDSSVTLPVWKRHGGAVRHIHGNFTEDSVALIKQYNSQQGGVGDAIASVSSTLIRGSPSLPFSPSKSPLKPTSSTGGKARRSVSSSSSTKSNSAKTSDLFNNVIATPLPAQKVEVFKYRCHKCDMYRTKHANELRVHLFNEFRYKRWKCLICQTTFTTEKSLKGHIERDHQKLYQQEFFELQSENFEIEAEINECIEKQNRKRDMINAFAVENQGKLQCLNCKEDGLTYDTFETHIIQKHSG